MILYRAVDSNYEYPSIQINEYLVTRETPCYYFIPGKHLGAKPKRVFKKTMKYAQLTENEVY